ncbi:Acg family FMN-binding oxidoreductase [Sandaracinobacteroides saxicola]|uniref:Twin-arginine translocation pathway signal protein n=1 Tax=Sandaracinobacteroides saxicola TaxID=2759707 RepID=A0A7G5IG97_9SPHN|nr:twin-arginine translocation pathway signal protein [Sandaracinobacteroides saxicola]QMW22389.1 twin-arginine translocation pathway signal protein [Sandaracinobacteroides saxicola]
MAIGRRGLIWGAGGATVALAAAGGGWWVASRPPETAREPWTLAGPVPKDVRLDAFRHAILAPNPHNRQPWRIRLLGDDAALLHCDLDRRLPATDPFDRQTVVGFGTFIELALLAATQRGVSVAVEPFPEGEPAPRLDARPVARLRFQTTGVAPDPLAAMIPHRRTNRNAFDRGPDAGAQAALSARGNGVVVRASADPALLAALRPLLAEAWRVEQGLPATWMESVELTRIGRAEVEAAPDGISLLGPMIEALRTTGVLTRDSLADPGSTAFSQGMAQQVALLQSLPGVLTVVTPDNSRADQITAGRAYARAALLAVRNGLDLHPASQALQEFPAMAALYARVHAMLAPKGSTVQMLARLGRGPTVPPAPRWPLARALFR